MFWGVVWAVLLFVFGTGAVLPALAENLVTNGDFSAGNTGFYSDYTLETALHPEGTYYIVSDAHDHHSGLVSCKDHTTGDGLYFAANGSPDTTKAVWRTLTAPTDS